MQSKASRWMIGIAVLAVMVGCGVTEKLPEGDATGEQPLAKAAEQQPVVAATEQPPAAMDRPLVAEGKSFAGWYMERAGQGMFQSCGQSQQWRVSGSADLQTKAQDFGLGEDTPVYVRLAGVQSADGNELVVSKVEQFGSATPVRDCGLTGVVIPAPAGN
ncbi:MAG: hypothetical protein LH470_10975 [Lysobacter sp.]|nr:hypothetical protein [Lysobacter sp.]